MFRIEFRTKKSEDAYAYPPPHRKDLRDSKDYHFWNIKMYKNGKVDSL